MTIDSMLWNEGPDVRSRAARILLGVGSALLVLLPSAALAQSQAVCGPELREEVAKALAGIEGAPDEMKPNLEKELYEKYLPCVQDAQLVPSSFYVAASECGASVSNVGSLFYEEMSCSGYDPQRRQFASPLRIKQTVGFGAAPLPGSREHVLHCVADASGTLLPVGHDSVHLANGLETRSPTRQFAVIANAHEHLITVYSMNGQTRVARSILSWGFKPTSCNYQPIWGLALNYRIRLDR